MLSISVSYSNNPGSRAQILSTVFVARCRRKEVGGCMRVDNSSFLVYSVFPVARGPVTSMENRC